MIGETVVVERPSQTGENAHGDPIYSWSQEAVEDVLVAPGAREDVPDATRPAGTEVAWQLHFPKSFSGSLRGARVIVRGGVPCPVIGDPQPFSLANTPTRWWLPVEVARVEG